MNPTAFVGTNTRIRVYENSLLRNEQFERMLQAPSFNEAVNVLNDTPYRNDVEELKETKDYDNLLMNELQRMYEDLLATSPGPGFIELFTLKYSYHNLKVLLKERVTGEDFDSMLIPIGRTSIQTLRQAVDANQTEDLDPAYLESIEEAISDYDAYQDIMSIDIILDRRYFTHLRKLAERLKDERILDLVLLYIDMNNLSTLTRAISQKRSRNFLTTILSSSGTMRKEDLVQLGSGDLVSAGQALRSGKYQDLIEASINPDTQELSPLKIDLETDNAFMRKMQDAKFETFGPMPTLGFIWAKENEVKNLRLVLVAKENNLPIDVVRERMRMNYGS